MAGPLLLALALLPQPAPLPVSDAAIVTRGAVSGRLPWAALGLGDGGASEAPRVAAAPRDGQAVTRGGVLVRARREGVKLDFPSGAELLIAPDGAVHLRGGEHTLPEPHPLELGLADGARLRIVPESAGRRPLRTVLLIEGEQALVLWRGEHACLLPEAAPRPSGLCLLPLGDGRVLYRAARLGPLLTLERVLGPDALATRFPPRRLIVLGDLLRHGLEQVARMPQVPDAVRATAAAAPILFPPGAIERPRGTVGALVFALASDLRLTVEHRAEDSLWLALHHADSAVPIVEWQLGPRTTLRLVRPDGGAGGGPRWLLHGIDLTAPARAALPLPEGPPETRQATAVLRALGARVLPQAVPAGG